MDTDEYVGPLEEMIRKRHLSGGGGPQNWANESYAYAKGAWVNDHDAIDQNYYDREIGVVNDRLALAGLRLAALLNRVFVWSLS